MFDFKERLRRELLAYGERGYLEADRIDDMLERSELVEVSHIREALTVLVTLVASAIMSLSFLMLFAEWLKVRSPVAFFGWSIAGFLVPAFVCWKLRWRTSAATLYLVGLALSGGALLVAKSYLLLCVPWTLLLLLPFAKTKGQGHVTLLVILGAGVLFGVSGRVFRVTVWSAGYSRMPFIISTVAAAALFALAWFRRGSVLFESQSRHALRASSLAIALGASFALTMNRGTVGGFGQAGLAYALINVIWFAVTLRLMVWFRKADESWLFGITLTYWSLFLFMKYYDLLWDLLSGSAVAFGLGLLLLALARWVSLRARASSPKDVLA